MKVLITGASGLLGGRLSHYLASKNLKVIKASRRKKNFTKLNWSSNKKLEKLCNNIDVIINCSGYDVHQSKNFKKTCKINAEYPLRLFTAANKKNVKLFIFLSTYHVYDFKSKFVEEHSKVIGKDFYTRSKILGEKKLLKFKNKETKVLVIRSCNLFGFPVFLNKNCWKLIINSMIKSLVLKKNFKINSTRDVYRYYSSIQSFCVFIKNILKKKKTLTFKNKSLIVNFTSDKVMSLTNLVNYIREIKKFKKCKIFYKHKKLKKEKKMNFSSKFIDKLYLKKDKFFYNEIKKLTQYVKKI
jgi:UDP-glucose 4-epimerase